jgi:hypothetical protein
MARKLVESMLKLPLIVSVPGVMPVLGFDDPGRTSALLVAETFPAMVPNPFKAVPGRFSVVTVSVTFGSTVSVHTVSVIDVRFVSVEPVWKFITQLVVPVIDPGPAIEPLKSIVLPELASVAPEAIEIEPEPEVRSNPPLYVSVPMVTLSVPVFTNLTLSVALAVVVGENRNVPALLNTGAGDPLPITPPGLNIVNVVPAAWFHVAPFSRNNPPGPGIVTPLLLATVVPITTALDVPKVTPPEVVSVVVSCTSPPLNVNSPEMVAGPLPFIVPLVLSVAVVMDVDPFSVTVPPLASVVSVVIVLSVPFSVTIPVALTLDPTLSALKLDVLAAVRLEPITVNVPDDITAFTDCDDPPLSVTVNVEPMHAVSVAPGSAPVLQFVAVVHCPSPPVPVQFTVQVFVLIVRSAVPGVAVYDAVAVSPLGSVGGVTVANVPDTLCATTSANFCPAAATVFV